MGDLLYPMIKQVVSTIILALTLCGLYAQDDADRITVLKSSRVDTSQAEVRAVVQLYEDYLNSKPDSIYDNPYWNQAEKQQYEDFDFSRASIFQGGMTARQVAQIFTPFVMSVEAMGEKYQIRVMFSSSTTDPQYAGSKVWCIQKLNAIRENGKWVLENLMVELSKKWALARVGYIDYIYPNTHHFDRKQAILARAFCEDITKRFNPDYDGTFKYYVTSSIDDMGLLENFDYYFVGSTTGKTREGMILTALGNEYYPHEFVHKLLPENPHRGYVIEEGLAEFLGTKMNVAEYEEELAKLDHDLQRNDSKINFKSVVSQKIRFNGYQTAYPAGAALCELVYSRQGEEGIRRLIAADTSDYEHLMTTMMDITQLDANEIAEEWKDIIRRRGRE